MSLLLDGSLLRRQYLVYVIELTNGVHRSFYVGQTGDRKHTTARPPFRRLMGHLEDAGTSTQNQLYRHVAADILQLVDRRAKGAFTGETKQAVEDFLVASTIEMHVYALEPFLPGVAHHDHLAVLRRVEDFERQIIKLFDSSGLMIANRNVHEPRDGHIHYPDVLAEIIEDFGLPASPVPGQGDSLGQNAQRREGATTLNA